MAGRTYRYSESEPLYPFGFGLSYTTFDYTNLLLQSYEIKPGDSLPVSVTVTNTGAVEGDEVVQLYLSDLQASTVVPLYSQVGFERVHLKSGERITLSFTILPEQIALVDDNGQSVFEPGKFRIAVGGCSPSTRGQALGAAPLVTAEFEVK